VNYGNAVTGPNPRGVPNVQVIAAGSVPLANVTDASGAYALTGFGSGSYTITPSKSGGSNGAITSFDAAKVAQFVSGGISLTSAQQSVADVSGTSGISSFDAALIARYASGLTFQIGSSGTWQFTPASITHASVTSSIAGENYAALLMGDVSGNWGDPSTFRAGMNGPERTAAVAAPRLVTPADNEVIIPVAIDGTTSKGIISYEFDLRYDASVIQPQTQPVDVIGTLSSGLSTVANAETPGLLRVVVYGTMPLEGSGVLMNLRFNAVGAPGTISPLTWERLMFNEGSPRVTMADGQVELTAGAPNSAEITGRLLTSLGAGVANARVTLTDTAGQSRSMAADANGSYRFGSLQVGQTYTVRVASRSVAFTPVTVSIVGPTTNVDVIAQ